MVYANARVISLTSPVITKIENNAGGVSVGFSANVADVAGQFVLQSSSSVSGPYSDVSSAITGLGGGKFVATLSAGGPRQFYRVKRIY